MRLLSSHQLKVLMIVSGLAIGLVATTGCYVGMRAGAVGAEFEVDAPPPPVRHEVVVVRPGPEYVWIGGYWDYEAGGRVYAWREGHWERAPRRHAYWVPPHYVRRGHHHYYRRGHWRY